MPPTTVASLDELDLGRAAAREQYLLTYAPGNRGRRVFSGPKGMTDHSAEFHVDMATLNVTALTIRRELKQALGRQHWSDKERIVELEYGWTGQGHSSGLSDIARPALCPIHPLDRF
jgi:hypothetical protein